MKTHQSLLLVLVMMCTAGLTAQDEPSIHDFNFESMSNPSFILLDETPTSFSMPDNLKALGLYLSNGFANTNIAVELNPYWVFGWNKEDTSYEQYRGISTTGDHTRIDPFQRACQSSFPVPRSRARTTSLAAFSVSVTKTRSAATIGPE